jgi:hypothetical protein
MAEQLAGIEEMTGTYPFDIARSVKGYRINKFLHDLVDPSTGPASSTSRRRRSRRPASPTRSRTSSAAGTGPA